MRHRRTACARNFSGAPRSSCSPKRPSRIGGIGELLECLRSQPAWSDIPVLLFADAERSEIYLRTLRLLEGLRNVVLLERPIRAGRGAQPHPQRHARPRAAVRAARSVEGVSPTRARTPKQPTG